MTTPLPKPVDFSDVPEFAHVWGYTADQLREYGQACREQALEEAAQICEAIANAPSNCVLTVALNCATAVRGWK